MVNSAGGEGSLVSETSPGRIWLMGRRRTNGVLPGLDRNTHGYCVCHYSLVYSLLNAVVVEKKCWIWWINEVSLWHWYHIMAWDEPWHILPKICLQSVANKITKQEVFWCIQPHWEKWPIKLSVMNDFSLCCHQSEKLTMVTWSVLLIIIIGCHTVEPCTYCGYPIGIIDKLPSVSELT